MNGLRGLAWLLALAVGRRVAGPRVQPAFSRTGGGHALAAARLALDRCARARGACRQFLLSHLSLLFVPVGVGVMTHLGLLGQYGVRMLVVIVLSTWIGLAVTALVLHHTQKPHHD